MSAAYRWALSGGSRSMPDGAVVLDPLAAWRWTVEYTPARLEQIKARRSLSEVIQLCDDMLTDDRLRSVAFMRAQALTGAELEFVEGQGRLRRRALRAADAESDLWEMLPEAEWNQAIVWGLLANFGTCRLRWWEKGPRGDRFVPRRRNGRIVPSLEFWHPRNFRLDAGQSQWWATVNQPGAPLAPVQLAMSFDDGEFCAFCPWGGAGDCSRGLWIAACKLWLLKQHIIRSGATLITRMSMPIKVVEFLLTQQGTYVGAEGGADAKREQLVNKLLAMQRNGVVSLPPGFTMKLLAMPATSVQMLQQQLDMCNDAFAILFLGNNLTTSIKGGSLAAANAGQEMLGFLRRADAQAESTFIHNDVMMPWARVNFGDAEAAPWPSRNVEPPEDLRAKAGTWLTAAQAFAAWEKAGVLLVKDAWAEEFEIPIQEGQPDNEAPPAPAPVMMPPGGLPPPAPPAPPPSKPVAQVPHAD